MDGIKGEEGWKLAALVPRVWGTQHADSMPTDMQTAIHTYSKLKTDSCAVLVRQFFCGCGPIRLYSRTLRMSLATNFLATRQCAMWQGVHYWHIELYNSPVKKTKKEDETCIRPYCGRHCSDQRLHLTALVSLSLHTQCPYIAISGRSGYFDFQRDQARFSHTECAKTCMGTLNALVGGGYMIWRCTRPDRDFRMMSGLLREIAPRTIHSATLYLNLYPPTKHHTPPLNIHSHILQLHAICFRLSAWLCTQRKQQQPPTYNTCLSTHVYISY